MTPDRRGVIASNTLILLASTWAGGVHRTPIGDSPPTPIHSQLPDQLMQGINFLRQSSKIELHEHTVRSVLRRCTAFDDPESNGRMTIPLQKAAIVVRASRQSMPSINIDSCADVSITEPVASSATGQEEAALFEPLGEQAQAGAVPEHDLQQVQPYGRGTGRGARRTDPAAACPAPASPTHPGLCACR